MKNKLFRCIWIEKVQGGFVHAHVMVWQKPPDYCAGSDGIRLNDPLFEVVFQSDNNDKAKKPEHPCWLPRQVRHELEQDQYRPWYGLRVESVGCGWGVADRAVEMQQAAKILAQIGRAIERYRKEQDRLGQYCTCDDALAEFWRGMGRDFTDVRWNQDNHQYEELVA